MHSGMLWYDNTPVALDIKIQKAADYYLKKYGRLPNLCLVHPSMLSNEKLNESKKIRVRAYQPVLPGHIWIGNEDKN